MKQLRNARINFIVILIILCFFTACKKGGDQPGITKPQINGLVQKGPFLNGTAISIHELNANFSPTGKVYSSQILDNTGAFQLKDVTLASQYVQLKADGYYFNEVTGANSVSPITLFALTDISNKSAANINILSHLEKSRIDYLVSNGMAYTTAKKKAEQEVLKVFAITKTDVEDFDLLDISRNSEDNAILLAVSVIMQGYRTESELSDLLANINTDLREDGILNTQALGSALINDARLINLTTVRSNIEKRYSNMGVNATIPNFEKYVTAFVTNAGYPITNNIEYPEFSTYGENLLYGNKTSFAGTGPFSMSAKLPKGTSLKLVVKTVDGSAGIQSLPNGPINWSVSLFDQIKKQWTFTTLEGGKTADLIFGFVGYIGAGGTYTIDYYENNATTPTRSKTFFK